MWQRLVLIIAVLVMLSAACAPAQVTPSLPEPRIVYGLTLMPSGFDPHINASAELGIPLRSVYDTLVYRHPQTGEFVPGLATRWESSEDGLSFTFYLRDNVTFHDGTPFNAEAVAINLDRILNEENGSQKARFMLGPITGYEILDPYTIRLTFSTPYAPLLDSLSQVYLGIASPAALSEYDTATYQFHQVGTGPFRMVEYVPGDRLVLTRNTDYAWGPDFYVLPDNPVMTIEFRFYEDPPTRSLALESGEVQIVGEIQPVDAQLLSGNPAVRLYPVAIPGQPLQFLMNTQRFPTDSRAVRQALIFATNRSAIIDTVFQRLSPVAYGPISAVTDFYYTQVAETYEYDLTRATALLEAAGFTEIDDDGIRFVPGIPAPTTTGTPAQPLEGTPTAQPERAGIPLKVTMVVPPWGQSPQVAQLIQSQWREIGIDVEIRQVAGFGQLREAAQEGDYNLIALNFFGRDPSLLNQFFTENGSLNWTGYSDIELNTYLQNALTEQDAQMRNSLYAAAQTRILEQALILPIRDYVNLNAVSASLQGVAFDAQGWFPLLHNFGWQAGDNG
ncbi:MAG: ABC transporter substrate-binding protein [Anaerolineae bacterium]